MMVEDVQTCDKINGCSCRLNGNEVIDLHSLVSGKHEPTFILEAKSEQTNVTYNYSYNPCINFLTTSVQIPVYVRQVMDTT